MVNLRVEYGKDGSVKTIKLTFMRDPRELAVALSVNGLLSNRRPRVSKTEPHPADGISVSLRDGHMHLFATGASIDWLIESLSTNEVNDGFELATVIGDRCKAVAKGRSPHPKIDTVELIVEDDSPLLFALADTWDAFADELQQPTEKGVPIVITDDEGAGAII